MSKRFSAILYLMLGSWILIGCGNKGELFLPPDPLLAQELETATQRTDDSDTDPDEEVTDKRKRLPEQRPEQPLQ